MPHQHQIEASGSESPIAARGRSGAHVRIMTVFFFAILGHSKNLSACVLECMYTIGNKAPNCKHEPRVLFCVRSPSMTCPSEEGSNEVKRSYACFPGLSFSGSRPDTKGPARYSQPTRFTVCRS